MPVGPRVPIALILCGAPKEVKGGGPKKKALYRSFRVFFSTAFL